VESKPNQKTAEGGLSLIFQLRHGPRYVRSVVILAEAERGTSVSSPI
jgi:hypothetical protein